MNRVRLRRAERSSAPLLSRSSSTWRAMTLLALALVALLLPLTTLAQDDSALYLVQLRSAPSVAEYTGGIAGYPATAAAARFFNAAGRLFRRRPRINFRGNAVRAFKDFLKRQQERVARDVNLATNKLLYSYTHVSNGFAASLTAQQAHQLERHPDVLSVTRSRVVRRLTTSSPAFLQLPPSLWAAAGGQSSAGEGVVVGIIDTGIWPEHKSFANDSTHVYGKAPSQWTGTCMVTSDFPATACNGKIVGARAFYSGFKRENRNRLDSSANYVSPRDDDGHGTWCAGAAAGNGGLVLGNNLGTASGMAPRARIAAYKVFWNDRQYVWASDADIAAAINQAVADGVDVLSLSLGAEDPTATYFNDLPYLNALAAGVVVAFAAGNAGAPWQSRGKYRTVDNFAPWYITVGASSISRGYAMSAKSVAASSRTPPSTTSSPVATESAASAAAQESSTSSQRTTATEKPPPAAASANASNSSSSSSSSNNKNNSSSNNEGSAGVATVKESMESVRAFMSGSVTSAATRSTPEAPLIASFSSRGPLMQPTANPVAPKPTNDILKPDIIAPGVELWSAGPGQYMGDPNSYFSALSGTSMATPHVAGIAALLVQRYPTWTPAMVMSAMMTTAAVSNNKGFGIRDSSSDFATPWDMGAGHVNPMGLLDVGLVYDADALDFKNFLAGQNLAKAKAAFKGVAVKAVKAYNLNRASISVTRLVGTVVLMREVTSVGNATSTYKAEVVVPNGVLLTVKPATFTIAPNETVSFNVTIVANRTGSTAFSYGSLTWRDQWGHAVRSVIVVQPLKLK
ncbi:unnamed protein product [Closterium sp. NIES-65]|nr:unnamed protein product [Closterium sp. NIES-65]